MSGIQSELVIGGERTVNDVIRTHPETVGVFNRFGIDACCGGAASIVDAAIRDGADPRELVAALNGVAGRSA